MHVASGYLKGRRLAYRADALVRPSSSKIKEAIMSMIRSDLVGTTILDLYCGTGAFIIEAVSNGAIGGVAIDTDISIVKQNIVDLNLNEKISLIKGDTLKLLSTLNRGALTFNLIFADPPYAKGNLIQLLLAINEFAILKADGKVIVEQSAKSIVPDSCGELCLQKQRTYGQTQVLIYDRTVDCRISR